MFYFERKRFGMDSYNDFKPIKYYLTDKIYYRKALFLTLRTGRFDEATELWKLMLLSKDVGCLEKILFDIFIRFPRVFQLFYQNYMRLK